MSDPLTILHGNCLEVLATLPDESVHCCVTSPPFLWLRDYGLEPVEWPAVTYRPMTGIPEVTVPAQAAVLGLECDPLAYIGHLVAIFREVRRVLRRDGTCWVEIGDGYANGGGPGGQGNKGQRATRRHTQIALHRIQARECDLTPKSRIGVPERLILALEAAGWYYRREVIWHKPNPMPESSPDRPTTAHSTILFLSRSPWYWYDAEAISEECSPLTHARMAQDIEGQVGSMRANDGLRRNGRPMKTVAPAFRVRAPGVNPKAAARPRGWQEGPGAHDGILKGSYPRGDADRVGGHKGEGVHHSAGGPRPTAMRRNSRSVWTIPIRGYSGNHYATFTAEVPRRCILAGCPAGGVVLDPFGGHGTTGLAALRLGRRAVLIEAKAEYVQDTDERTRGVQLGLGIGAGG